jgi:hypothetical protein
MKRIHRAHVLIAGACVAGVVAGSTFAVRGPGGADQAPPPAKASFSALAAPAPAHVEPELADLASHVGATAAEARSFRVLGRNLGRFESRLVAFSAKGGSTICYALLGADATDPGASYCYQPNSSALPDTLTGQHFNVMAPQHYVDGEYGTQLFGIAFDDVVKIRAQVKGAWVNVPLRNNGFFLDLPGVRTRAGEVALVEATLRGGSKQYHDVRTGG